MVTKVSSGSGEERLQKGINWSSDLNKQKRNKERKKERKTHIYKLTDTKATKNQKSGSVGYSSLLSW